MAGPVCQRCGSTEFMDAPETDEHGRCVQCREFPTLGHAVNAWIEAMCVIPDREDAGQPFRLTDEQYLIFLHHYRLNPFAVQDDRGRWRNFWVYARGSQVEKPQKWGKAPLSSAWACAEAAADVLFDGWDAHGRPVGRPWPTPHIQITACSEDQTDNVWRALMPMIQLGPLADVFPDTGLTRINLPSGGLMEPVTASAVSRLGQRITASVQDQTESWLSNNGGHKLADNQRRGLAAFGGRFLSTPNAFDPVQDSVAQRTAETKAWGVYQTYVEPRAGSVRNRRERREVLREQYGDSTVERGGWIDLDRIDVEIEALVEHDPAQAERWFLNRRNASEGAAFDLEAWDRKAKPKQVRDGAQVGIFIDGALYDDALAVIGIELQTGYLWPLGIWERPENAGDDYEHPRHEVDQVVQEAFDKLVVWRLYADPHWIEALVEGWQNRYGEKRVIPWFMHRHRQVAWAVRNFEEAVARSEDHKSTGRPPLTHSGDPVLRRHIANSRRKMLTVLDDRERPMHTLSKPAARSPLKIDGAMASVGVWELLGDAIGAGAVWMGNVAPTGPEAPERPQVWKPGTAPALPAFAGSEAGPMGGLS
jgi:hypothetical protein